MITRREKERKRIGAVDTDCSRKCAPAVRCFDFGLPEASYYCLFIHLPASLRIMFHRWRCVSEISITQPTSRNDISSFQWPEIPQEWSSFNYWKWQHLDLLQLVIWDVQINVKLCLFAWAFMSWTGDVNVTINRSNIQV